MDLMGYLRGNFVKRKRRDQADDAAVNSGRYGDQVGISEWFAVGKTIYTTTDHRQRSDIAHGVKCARMDARPQRLSRAKDTAVFPENSNCPVEPGTLLIRFRWNFDKITFTYLFVLVILSNLEAMSRDTVAYNPKYYLMVMYSGDSSELQSQRAQFRAQFPLYQLAGDWPAETGHGIHGPGEDRPAWGFWRGRFLS